MTQTHIHERKHASPAHTEAHHKYHGRYAGFWQRFIAFLIDFVILSIITVALEALFGFQTYNRTGYGMGLFAPLYFIIWWAYFALMESSKHQATVGKMAMGIKVIDIHFHQLNFLRATGRYFSKFLSLVLFGLGFVMIAVTDNKQGLHDRIADTLVIRK